MTHPRRQRAFMFEAVTFCEERGSARPAGAIASCDVNQVKNRLQALGLLDRAFAASTNWSVTERALQIFEFDVSRPPGFSALVLQCEKTDAAAWDAVCDQLVTKLQDAPDLSARVHAYELQMRRLEARGRTEEVAALRERPVAAIVGVDTDETLLTATANLLLNDEVLLSRFLQDVESLGEIAAFRQLTDDVAKMQSSDRYDECQFIDNPYLDI